jgi:nanoRNase/pAp phosphatase (c-di-AMP/oligoRNAs hydrolase)
LRGFQTINPSDLHAVGVVDTQSRERLGPAEAWLSHASHVAVYDHHVDASGDISADELILEPVGSATTVLVERLRRHIEGAAAPGRQENSAAGGRMKEDAGGAGAAAGAGTVQGKAGGAGRWPEGLLTLSQAEATLFALGIRADTGGLSYADTTPRDGHALVREGVT